MELTVPCPKCGEQTLTLDIELSGGCMGHGPEEYCYCSSPDATIQINCTNRWYKNGKKKPTCSYTHKPYIGGDSDSIARLLINLLNSSDAGKELQRQLIED